MKVALEKGEKMNVSIVENDKIVGTLTITFESVLAPKAPKSAPAEAPSAAPMKTRKKRTVSPEAREKMRQAQLRRWEKIRGQAG